MGQLAFDPYATLGISPRADAGQVRVAYRRLARQHHPDRSNDRQATERMKRINQAWEILSSPARRARYDADRAASRAPSGGHWSAPPRAAGWSPPPPAWSAGSTSIPRSQPVSPRYDDGEGRSWPAILGVLVLLLVLGPLLLGTVPGPALGLFVLLAAGWATRRMG